MLFSVYCFLLAHERKGDGRPVGLLRRPTSWRIKAFLLPTVFGPYESYCTRVTSKCNSDARGRSPDPKGRRGSSHQGTDYVERSERGRDDDHEASCELYKFNDKREHTSCSLTILLSIRIHVHCGSAMSKTQRVVRLRESIQVVVAFLYPTSNRRPPSVVVRTSIILKFSVCAPMMTSIWLERNVGARHTW